MISFVLVLLFGKEVVVWIKCIVNNIKLNLMNLIYLYLVYSLIINIFSFNTLTLTMTRVTGTTCIFID